MLFSGVYWSKAVRLEGTAAVPTFKGWTPLKDDHTVENIHSSCLYMPFHNCTPTLTEKNVNRDT